jgi:predicted transcriptional regulator
MINGLSFETLDFLLRQVGYEVRYEDNEWVWVQSFPHSDLIVHGTPYTREQAYEDVLRSIMGLIPIADEKIT